MERQMAVSARLVERSVVLFQMSKDPSAMALPGQTGLTYAVAVKAKSFVAAVVAIPIGHGSRTVCGL